MNSVSSTVWNMWINNCEITGLRKMCISSIEFDELCDGSDICTLTITDPNFEFIEDNIFIDEASIEIEFGFEGDVQKETFNGYISTIDINFPEDGSPTLTVTCLDQSHLMNRVKKDRSWDNVTRADVVRKIASEYGFYADIEWNYTFATEETISQSKQTDIEFLESLAGEEREPFICKLVNNTLVYHKKGLLQNPVATLGYKTYPFDVISFSPQINKETRQEEITRSEVNTDKRIDTYTADDNIQRDVQGESATNTSSANSGEMVYDPVSRTWKKK